MKILQILYPGLGGHSSVAFSLVEGDRDLICQHHMLGYGIERPTTAYIEKTLELNVPSDYILKKIGIDLTSQIRVYKMLKEIKPDVIIMHSTAVVLCAFLYSKVTSARLIAVEHQSNQAKHWKDWIYSFLILTLIPKVVYLTESYRGEMKQFFKFLVGRNTCVINNGINSRFYHRGTEKLSSDHTVFFMMSRMTPLRDHFTLIKAFSEFIKSNNAKMYIAGDGSTMKDIINLISELSLQNHVILLGTINEKSILGMLKIVDIYIHSSLSETLSTSLLQVMSCQIPIIATNIPGINNLLTDNSEALLFEPENKSDLLLKMQILHADPNLRERLVANAYKKIISTYECGTMFNKYYSLADAKK
jgi:glycosyltransferase involved in cell wall biosynthesis